MTINKELSGWLHDHSIRVLDTNKRAHRVHKYNMKYFKDPSDYNYLSIDAINYETEPLYTVEIAESELLKIQRFEDGVFNNLRESGHYNMFQYLMEQKEEEKRLRAKSEAVQLAYEHYSLMLKLAKE